MEIDQHEVHLDDRTLNCFADGILPEAADAVVRAHLLSCATCREQVHQIRALSAALRSLPTPRPPAGQVDEFFPETREAVAVLPFTEEQWGPTTAPGLSGFRALTSLALAAVVALIAIALTGDRASAGASTLTLGRSDGGVLNLSYVTVFPPAEADNLRARIRYWVPNPLRFTQTTPGHTAIDLARTDVERFEAVAGLPPETVYAVAVVEDVDGNRIDSNRGAFWEYLRTDSRGRPTLDARLHQLMVTAELNPSRAAEVAAQALSEYGLQPELWVASLLFRQEGVGDDVPGIPIGTYRERLEHLDRVAREGEPGAGEMYALSLQGRLLGREDIEAYWRRELSVRQPRHEYASQLRLETILLSSLSKEEQLGALERSWRLAPMPSVAQVGLQLSQEAADPARTRTWLDRYAAEPVLRDFRLDVEVAERMMDTPALRTIAEEWIVELLNGSADWLGAARPLRQTRTNFDAEAAESRARLLLLLGRLRLARDDRAAAAEAFENAAGLSWQPEILVELAEFHAEAGSAHRASELLALVRTDPVIPLAPHRPAGEARVPVPTEDRLEDARAAWREHVASLLLDEPITRTATLETATGEETMFREVAGSEVTVVIQSLRPGYVPVESLDLLRANAGNLEPAGVRVLPVAVTPDPPAGPESTVDWGIDSIPPFHYDKRFELWDALGAWREVQYSVLGRDGHLKYRGEDLMAALRVALMLGDELASSRN